MTGTVFALCFQTEIFIMLKLSTTIDEGEKGRMDKYIETPSVGEILNEEFMIPMNISAYKLAKAIDVPVSRIQEILHGRRKITVDTSLRLGKYFGVSEKYFLNLQTDIDLRNLKVEEKEAINRIVPYAAGFATV